MRRILRLSLTAMVLSAMCALVWAQATAQIGGTVRDQSGAVMPGVEITVTQTATGASRTTITNETGSYILPSLPLGPYRLEASLPGFRTHVETGIVLQVDKSAAINVVLEIGQVAETVEVQANAATVETRSVGIAQVIETERILELPLDGREVESLITLAGGAVDNGEGTNRSIGGRFISVAGGLGTGVEYQLDGANHMNYTSSVGQPMPFPDALQEFNVRNSGLTAESGRGAGVGAVTKSGTNKFDGVLFNFVRNDLFNAREYFAPKGSTLKRNQFGGTLGGPILRNKLFFFGGFQGTTIRQDPGNVRQFVPSAEMLAGDWTTFASPRCQSRALTLRAPFAGNRIDPALYSQASLKIVNRFLPKTNDPCGEVTFGRRSVEDDVQIVGRIDHQMTNDHSLFGRYFVYREHSPSAWNFDKNNFLNVPVNTDSNMFTSIALGSTYLVGPNVVNSFRATYVRTMIRRMGNVWLKDGICEFGVKVYCGYTPGHMNLAVSGGFNLNQTSKPDDWLFTESYEIGDDLSVVRSNHQVTFGGGLNRTTHSSRTSSKAPPEIIFRGNLTGSGLADFMTGRLDHLEQFVPSSHNPIRWFPRAFVADAWRATPNLTLNLGIRWEPFLPEQRPAKTAYNFDYERFRKGIKSKVFLNAPAGFLYYGDTDFPNGTAGVNKIWKQFSPRLGLAWDVTGDGRTSIRASYAYSYETQPMQFTDNLSASPPFGQRITLIQPSGGFEDPWRDVPGGNPFPSVLTPNVEFPAFGGFQSQPFNQKLPRTGTWNLNLQRQLRAESVLSISYLGTLTTQLPDPEPINAATYIPGGPCVLPDGRTYNPCSTAATTDLRRRFSLERWQDGRLLGFMSDLSSGGNQNYHGFVTSLRTRPAGGVNINTNYTWSHCIGDAHQYQAASGAKGDARNPRSKFGDRRFDRGNCDSDRRHLFNLTAVMESPRFANPTMRAIGTGWRLATIYRLSSGSPLGITFAEDRALTGTGGQRPNQVLADVFKNRSAGPLEYYLNPEAFALPALGTFGAMGKNVIAGPGTWDFDIALSRDFNLHEAQRLEFRAEAYNVPNSFRPLNPNADTTNRNFGQIRTSRSPRIMQFAVKYVF